MDFYKLPEDHTSTSERAEICLCSTVLKRHDSVCIVLCEFWAVRPSSVTLMGYGLGNVLLVVQAEMNLYPIGWSQCEPKEFDAVLGRLQRYHHVTRLDPRELPAKRGMYCIQCSLESCARVFQFK